jgi:hypothetical protein
VARRYASELARERAISPSVVRRWQHLRATGSAAAVVLTRPSCRQVNSAWRRSVSRSSRALGKKAREIEILQAARDAVQKRPRYYGVSTR